MNQRAAYEALAARLGTIALVMGIGVPRSLQTAPAAFVVATGILPGARATFGGTVQPWSIRPTLTLAVPWQDQTEAEWQIVDLVDLVVPALIRTPLDDVCRCAIETILYDWRAVGGVDYRVADLTLLLSQV